MSPVRHRLAVPLALFVILIVGLRACAAAPEIVSVAKIWDKGRHNAFTDLIRWRSQWFCTFREADAHVGGDGKLRVLVSADGVTWEAAGLVEEVGIDLRDPKLSVTPDDRLMIVAGGSVYKGGKTLLGRQARVAFSKDGRQWTPPQRILAEGDWLWRVTWHEGRAYGVAYNGEARGSKEAQEAAKTSALVSADPADWKLKLVVSDDGVKYDVITHLGVPGFANETTLRFLPDGEVFALVRREGGNTFGWLGRSKPPYKDWRWHETNYRLGGPNFCRLPDGSLWAVSRSYPGGAKTALARMGHNCYEPVLTLPSGGDTSYAGLVWHDGHLWVSYYSSHEGKSSIYLAKIRLPLKPVARESQDNHIKLGGEVVDAESGRPLPARVYIQGKDGTWYFPRSAAALGSAVSYRKQRTDQPRSVEMHTTLSAHPFVVDLAPGVYTITVEHGKEYRPLVRTVTLGQEAVTVELPLQRWVDVAERGWFSGDTHVHRSPDELPNILLAEDLNVAFPLSYWVTDAFASPKTSSRNPLGKVDPRVIPIDATHVSYPLNTEYELFTVNKQRHTLGAFFALNHQNVLDQGAPPVRVIAEQVHREGGLIELDKHNWPWTMALVPVLKPDLYELANNHAWRTEFGFPSFGEPAPDYMKVERTAEGFTERGWIDYGLQNYYALLNCGFRLKPTAGTASGVHPVPLGFGRVYVRCPQGFSYDTWLQGLRSGRSFVTTGPMLFVQVDGEDPGHVSQKREGNGKDVRVGGTVLSEYPLERVEIIINGEVARTVKPANQQVLRQAYETKIDEKLLVEGTSWIAVRCFEDRPDRRSRFAHSSPVYLEVADKPLRPRRPEVEFLIKRVEEQIGRSAEVLPPTALAEYQEALQFYRRLAHNAR